MKRLKSVGLIVIAVSGLVGTYFLFFRLPTALQNEQGATPFSVEALVEKNTPHLYVNVEGFLDQEGGYIYGEGGPDPIYYLYLVPTIAVPNPKPFYRIVVQVEQAPNDLMRFQSTSITGMTRPTPKNVRALIREDMAANAPYGVVSTHTIYIVAGETPNELPGIMSWIVASLLGVLAGAVPIVFGRDEEEK